MPSGGDGAGQRAAGTSAPSMPRPASSHPARLRETTHSTPPDDDAAVDGRERTETRRQPGPFREPNPGVSPPHACTIGGRGGAVTRQRPAPGVRPMQSEHTRTTGESSRANAEEVLARRETMEYLSLRMEQAVAAARDVVAHARRIRAEVVARRAGAIPIEPDPPEPR